MVNTKIDLKTAVEAARNSARDVLGWNLPQVEEIEREAYSGHDAWAITLSDSGVPVLGFALQSPYKRFFVDADTGDVLGLITYARLPNIRWLKPRFSDFSSIRTS